MLFKSNLLASASGKLNGNVFARNRGGAYVRNLSVPTNPNTPAQIAVRATMGEYSRQWSNTLTQTQRDGWNAYAEEKTVTNKLGDQVKRSGQNWFVGSNQARSRGVLTAVLDAPSTAAGEPYVPPTVTSVSAASNEATIEFGATDSWATSDGGALIIYASRPQSAGVNYFRGPYQVAGTILGSATTAPTSPATITLPFNVEAGDKVFFRATIVEADGSFAEEQMGFQLGS